MRMKVWFRGIPQTVTAPAARPDVREYDRDELLTHEWLWQDGVLHFRKRQHPLLFNYRKQRATRLRHEIEAQMRGLSESRWELLENAIWSARKTKRFGVERDRVLYDPAWFLWQKYANNTYYHARIATDPEWRDRLWRQSRERYAKLKTDAERYTNVLAYHRDYAKRTGLRKRQHAATMADPKKRAKKNADLRTWRAKKKAERLALAQRQGCAEAAE